MSDELWEGRYVRHTTDGFVGVHAGFTRLTHLMERPGDQRGVRVELPDGTIRVHERHLERVSAFWRMRDEDWRRAQGVAGGRRNMTAGQVRVARRKSRPPRMRASATGSRSGPVQASCTRGFKRRPTEGAKK